MSGGLVLGGDVHDTVVVDAEGHFNLRYAAGRRGDAGQLEAAQGLVVVRHLAFALQHVDFHGGLAVRGRGEHLALAGGDGGVPVDQAGEDVAFRLQAQAQGRDVQQQHILDLAAQHAALDGRADGDALVRVDALEGLLAGNLLHGVLHRGNPGAAADQDHLVDLVHAQAGVLQGLAHGFHRGVHQVAGQFVKLRPGQGHVQVLRARGVGGDEGQVDVGGGGAAQLDLRLFGGFLQALAGDLVLLQVNAVVLFELLRHVINDPLVEVVAAQAGVTVGAQHFEDAVADVQDADVEGAAAQVVHQDLLVLFLVQAVGQRSGRRLVDDAQHFQAGDAAGVLGGLTLAVVEVRGHGDDRLGHFLAQVALGRFLHFAQHHCADILGCILLAVDVHLVGGAHFTLDGNHGAFRIGDGLALGHLADQALSVLGEGHHGRGRAAAFSVRDHDGLAAFHHGDAAVGCTQVNTDNLAHCFFLPLSVPVMIVFIYVQDNVCYSGTTFTMACRSTLSPIRYPFWSTWQTVPGSPSSSVPCSTAFSRFGSNFSPCRSMGVTSSF